ncbi:hypothetical protein [Mesorhizobium sp. Pch-S]|uniref:hypothetical protein n=1 Tax=Mesorhizobium sp. Pch-S TaxID=2082387 RepID=UPI001011DEA0|nr:hypothetical protein [Mesorhizobium sp. Pch-S]QAZ46779.1 hypothetical protein C1M53_31490 [Mesorhizobium sp. Pch-S]
MSEIPEDVMQRAKNTLAGWTIDDGTISQFDECAKSVALAIMAERERCVEVVESWRKRMFGGQRLYIFADEVVQAIRRGN